MILRDFMLLTERLVDSNNQLIKKDGKIARSPEGIIVERNSKVVCSIINEAIKGKIKTPNFWRICLLFNHSRRDTKELIPSGGVIDNYCEINYSAYFSLYGNERGDYLLNFIIENSLPIFDYFDIDKKHIEKAAAKSTKSLYEFMFRGKVEKSPFNKQIAFIEIIQKLDFSEVYLVVKNGSDIVYRQKISTEDTNPFQFQIHFGELTWMNEFKIKITRADNQEFLYNISA